MDAFSYLASLLGGTAFAIAAATFLAKKLVTQWLQRDLLVAGESLKRGTEELKSTLALEKGKELEQFKGTMALEKGRELEQFKVELGFEKSNELEQIRAALSLSRDQAGWRQEAVSARNDRIRAEVLRWANPILGAIQELERRLVNILEDHAEVALSPSLSKGVAEGWSIRYDYFMPSTLYLFAQYFYWVRRLQIEMSFELFETQADKDKFFEHIGAVGAALGNHPMDGWRGSYAGDTQVFSLQQRAIAAAMTVRSDGSRCMEVDEFMDAWLDSPLSDALCPLKALLEGVDASSAARWFRLEQVHVALRAFKAHCVAILKAPAA